MYCLILSSLSLCSIVTIFAAWVGFKLLQSSIFLTLIYIYCYNHQGFSLFCIVIIFVALADLYYWNLQSS